jgi:hypothetical protein
MLIGAVMLAVVLAACGGSDDDTDAAPTTATSTSSSSTTTMTAEQAFLADVDDQMSFGDDSGPTAALSFADGVCSFFDTLSESANDNVTPTETDEMVAVAVERWLGEIGDDESGVLIMRLAGEHLCPEHADAIERGVHR